MRREDIPPPITYGSVCSGIEAATVAWRPLGWHAAWFAEIEPYPCAVLAHHYPDVPNLGDMTKVARLIRDGYAPAPEILCGGTPCQAFSIAGLRNSLDDARGNLSLVFCEIADEIDKRRAADGLLPAVIIWENVPGVLSTKDNAFGCFLTGLAGEDDPIVAPGGKWPNAGCVYGPKRTVAWRVLDAQYFGVAQRRRRVFVIASAREGFDPAEVLFEFDGVRRDTPPSRESRQDAAVGTIRSTDGGSDVDHAVAGHLIAEDPGTARQDDGHDSAHGHVVAPALARCDTAGEGWRQDYETCTIVPVLAAPVARSVERPRGDGLDTLIAGTLQANGKAAGSATQQDAEAGMLIPIAFSMKDYGGDASFDLAPTLRAGNHSESHANGGNPPAIAFDARQTPVSSIDVFGALGSSSPQAQAVCIHADAVGRTGDAITPSADAEGRVRLRNPGMGVIDDGTTYNLMASGQPHAVCVTGEIAHTLKAEGFDASEDGTGRGQPIVPSFAFAQNTRDEVRLVGGDGEVSGALAAQPGMKQTTYIAPGGMAVRRLTPRECERLQSFPDDYTLIPYGRVVKMEKLEQDWIKYLLRGGVMTLNQVCQAAADGPRYKALGNSWCVYNVRWLGRRINTALLRSNVAAGEIARVA